MSHQPTEPNDQIDEDLRAALQKAIAENEALGPSVVAPDAAYEFMAVPGQPAIACRTVDTAGRRVTQFIAIQVSHGRDAVADAERIATLLAAHAAATARIAGLEEQLAVVEIARDRNAEDCIHGVELLRNNDARIAAIAERAMLACSDPHLSAAEYRQALTEVCNLALSSTAGGQ